MAIVRLIIMELTMKDIKEAMDLIETYEEQEFERIVKNCKYKVESRL